jgi:hypothetical protein
LDERLRLQATIRLSGVISVEITGLKTDSVLLATIIPIKPKISIKNGRRGELAILFEQVVDRIRTNCDINNIMVANLNVNPNRNSNNAIIEPHIINELN